MPVLDDVFAAGDRIAGSIGYGRVPGLDDPKPATPIGYGGQAPPGGSTPVGYGSVPGSVGLPEPQFGSDPFLHGPYGEYLMGRQQEWMETLNSLQPTAGGTVTSPGGSWAQVDQWDTQVQQASSQTGVPANLIKAVMRRESGGVPGSTSVAGAQGLMQVMPMWGQTWGLDLSDPAQNILAGAMHLKKDYDNYGNWDMAIRAYLGFGTDAYGTTDESYLRDVKQYWDDLNSWDLAGPRGSMDPALGGVDTGSAAGNNIVSEAMQFVGVPYVWGAIPGANENPWVTGWDCSGFTYWLDQKYGSGDLPMGSHLQFDYAQRTGQLFSSTARLQPGDLVFFDTGSRAGGGAHLNAASHVGVYVGNGQMLHAANPSTGTILSNFNDYTQMYRFLGAMHSSYSGGAAGVPGGGGGGAGYAASPTSTYDIMSRLMRGESVPGYSF